MNYGSAFDEKSGWGRWKEGKKTMDQLSMKMWVWKNDKKYGSLHHKNVSKKQLYKKILNCGSGG